MPAVMRKFVIRGLAFCLILALGAGVYVGWRAWSLFQTTYGGFQHLRYLLESGETVEGTPADDVLSDNYLLSLFGDNPELVERLKTVVDLGMATDANLKLGSVSAMIITYRKDKNNEVSDAAIYAVGGFPDPKSKRLGFHSSGYFQQELDPAVWLSGNAVMNLLGRDVIVFCEQDKAESHMSLLFDLLNGGVISLAQRVANDTLHYAVVFPDPKELSPPSLRNHLQTIIIRGEMSGDGGKTETIFISPTYQASAQVFTLLKDMAKLARVTFRDNFGGFLKETPWGKMNDTWWAVQFVEMIDNFKLVQDQVLVVARNEFTRPQNNTILKTIERAGRDLAAQKSFSLAGEEPWEFAYLLKENPSGGYWSAPHRWGQEWPLGDEGIPTPGSVAAAAERARLQAENEAAIRAAKEAAEKLHLDKEQLKDIPASLPSKATL